MGEATDLEKAKTFSGASKIAISSALGFGFEMFDFTAYVYASTLFAPLFFPTGSYSASLVLAFLTASLTFFSRPVGGIIFGHFGDRIGRKPIWLLSLLGMGVVSITMGFLPTYQQIGIAATLALIILRIFQGFFTSGEQCGGWVLSEEFSPCNWRGFFGSVAGMGAGLSQVMLSIAIFIASYFAPGAQMAVLGWRIIFWVGVAPLVVALISRWKVSESIEWKAKVKTQIEKVPLVSAIKRDKRFFLIVLLAYTGQNLFVWGSITFLPSFLKLYTTIGTANTATVVLVANLFVMAGVPIWGYFSDRTKSRRKFLVISYLINAAVLLPLITILGSSNVSLSLIAGIILGFVNPLGLAVLPAWVSENTKTSERYSIMGTAHGLGVAFGGMAPYLVVAFSSSLGAINSTAMFAILGCLIAAAAISFSPADRVGKDLQ
jgi:MFS family permease